MKIKRNFVLCTLGVIVKGWLNAAVRGIEPILLSFGAAFVALKDVNLNDYLIRFDEIYYPHWHRMKFGKWPANDEARKKRV